jgi:solute carrier family 25 ornithine transporter 2/15
MAGICFWMLMFPIDSIKSRIQVFQPNMSTMKYTLEIIKNEGNQDLINIKKIIRLFISGFLALYAGLFPTLLRTFFATGTLFITYEQVQLLLHRVL